MINLNNALNIMYANENRKLLTIEPNTKEYEYYQGRVNAYEEAIELLYISDGMPVEYATAVKESDLDLIEKEQKELNVAIGNIVVEDAMEIIEGD